MASSMLESILGPVTPQMQQAIAARLGESPQAVHSGLRAGTAATLSALARHIGDSNFSEQVMQMVTQAGGQSLLGSFASIASGGPTDSVANLISRFQSLVFGAQQGQIASLIAQHAGISASSANGILKMAAPLVLGYLAKLHSAGALSASTLGSTLTTTAANLSAYAPSASLKSAAATADTTVRRTAAVVESRASGFKASRWVVPAAIVGLLLVAWLVLRSSVREPAQTADEAASRATSAVSGAATNALAAAGGAASAAGDAATAAWASLGEFFKVTLPDGTVLNVPSRGVEARLVRYLEDNSTGVTTVTGFDFDRLLFDTGKATLQPASTEQLNNVAAILKAFPNAKIRLGGYTDNSGDATANQLLSEQRADNVMAELTGRGIDASRLSAKGYGEDDPVADNSTEEGRQKNRRISIRVAEK